MRAVKPNISFSSRNRAFTLLEIMIVVAIIGLILAIALPNFLKTRINARKQICIENLTQIENAKQIWGVEHGKKDGDVPTDADMVGPTLYMKTRPQCPGGGIYDFKPIGQVPTCTLDGHSLGI